MELQKEKPLALSKKRVRIPQSRYGDWIQIYSGGKFYPLDPRPEEVFIEDIAHALSMLCRYTGHINRFYSVAEHSWHVSHHVPKKYALWGLLHDATEAYLLDLARPIKYMPEMDIYRRIEHDLQTVIMRAFGLQEIEPPEVKAIDRRMLKNESRVLFNKLSPDWKITERAIRGVEIHGWLPSEAERNYLERFRELTRT